VLAWQRQRDRALQIGEDEEEEEEEGAPGPREGSLADIAPSRGWHSSITPPLHPLHPGR
jgi:hypothetical protein